MKKIFYTAIIAALTFSCTDLNIYPENTESSAVVFSTLQGTKQALAKVYAAYTVSGNQGPAGKNDISFPGADEGGNCSFLRVYFNAQEMPTDEAHCLWNDPGIPELNDINFTANGQFVVGLYYRLCMQIMYANDFLRNAKESLDPEVAYMKAEARWIRAFDYWCLMDLFGNPPFFTENNATGSLPTRITRTELFTFIESELNDLIDNNRLHAARTNEYGRADIGAAEALMARMYLNAEVYTGTARWADASDYAARVIGSGYSLQTTDAAALSAYEKLFLADNNITSNNEFILTINFDGINTRSYGSTTFLINCTFNTDMVNDFESTILGVGISVNFGWNGYRVRKDFADKFEPTDKRRLLSLSKNGANDALGSDPTVATNGMHVYKWRNIKSTSVMGSVVNGSNNEFADTDFPLFRLAEMYLIYAEAAARGAGSKTVAVGYINDLRARGGVTAIAEAQLTPQFVLDERARELYWECHRRTDLIRFGQLTGSGYIWEWKGGVQSGRAVDDHFNIFPIPASDLNANRNLQQNPKY